MKTRFIALACIAALFLTSCEKKQPKCQAKKLRINMMLEPETLDPRRAHSLTDINLAKMFMEGLTRVGKKGKAELALAHRYTLSDDLKTYRFTLRDAKWSNGEPITAHDFVYAWKQTLSPEFPSSTSQQLFVIKNAKGVKAGTLPPSLLGVRATSDKTLVIQLESPTPYFLELLSAPVFFPVNQGVDKRDPTWAASCETYVCNGPFAPTVWKQRDLLAAKKNPLYWDAKQVKLNAVEMVVVDPSTALGMFDAGQLDWSGSPLSLIPQDALATLKKTGSIHTQEALGTYLIRLNTERPALTSVKIRKALALAINRKELVEHVLQGDQPIATSLVPGAMHLSERGYFTDADLEMAKKLFSEALVEENLSPTTFKHLTLLHTTGDRALKTAQAVQQQWRAVLGIEVKLQAIEPKVYFDRVAKRDYDLACGSWIADFNDPINFLNVFKARTNGTNHTHWESADYMAKLDASSATKDLKERATLLRESEKILMNDMPIIPLHHYNMVYAKKPGVKDVLLTNMGTMDIKCASID